MSVFGTLVDPAVFQAWALGMVGAFFVILSALIAALLKLYPQLAELRTMMSTHDAKIAASDSVVQILREKAQDVSTHTLSLPGGTVTIATGDGQPSVTVTAVPSPAPESPAPPTGVAP